MSEFIKRGKRFLVAWSWGFRVVKGKEGLATNGHKVSFGGKFAKIDCGVGYTQLCEYTLSIELYT